MENIPFQDINFYKPLIADYLNQKSDVEPLVSHFFDEKNIEHFIQKRQKFDVDRDMLFEAVADQYKNSGCQVPEHLTLLKEKNTFTVTTGHQLSLMGGPLFLVYKIITTIDLTQRLNQKYSKYNFVPVFWMATEDHDFEEINHIHLFGNKIAWQRVK